MRKLLKDECFVLVIYDIVNDRRRNKLMRYLNGYGFRVQKSCYEAILSKKMYRCILKEIPQYIDKTEDSVRIYKFNDRSKMTGYGILQNIDEEIAGIV